MSKTKITKTKKASEPKHLQLLLLTAGGFFLILLTLLVATGSAKLQTAAVPQPAIIKEFTAVGRLSKSAEIESNDRILFSWEVGKNGVFHHVKLERLDKDKTKELDLAGFANNRVGNRVNIDLVPYWLEKSNRFRLSACADKACTKSSTQEVVIKVADYDPNREPAERPDPVKGDLAQIVSFTAEGKQSGSKMIASSNKVLFSWELKDKGSFHHLQLMKVNPANDQQTEVDLGQFNNNRKANRVDLDFRVSRAEQANIFRLLVCQDKECQKKNTAEVRVKVEDHDPDLACKFEPLKITTTELPFVSDINRKYKEKLLVTGGKAPYKWVIKSGHLPKDGDFRLDQNTGIIESFGLIPNTYKSYEFTVEVTDSSFCTPPLKAEKTLWLIWFAT